ncbi:MAG: hypothetical protein ACOC54_06280 [Candidatus Sumerlaeota bacterium]
MPNKFFDIETYRFSKHDRFLVDANVLLLVYGPIGPEGDSRVGKYSRAIKNAITAKSQMYVDAVVMTEFANRYLHLRKNQTEGWQSRKMKEFREADSYAEVAEEMLSGIKAILKRFQPLDTPFSGIKNNTFISSIKQGLV